MTIEHAAPDGLNISQRAIWWAYEVRRRWPLVPAEALPARALVEIDNRPYSVEYLDDVGLDGIRSFIPDELADPEFIDCPQCGEITGHPPGSIGEGFCSLVTGAAEFYEVGRDQVEAIPELALLKIVMNPTLEELALLVNDP